MDNYRKYDDFVFDKIYNENISMTEIGKQLGISKARVSIIAIRAFTERGLLKKGETIRQLVHNQQLDKVCASIKEYWDKYGLPPSQIELSEMTGLQQARINFLLKVLRKAGRVEYRSHSGRSLKLVSPNG